MQSSITQCLSQARINWQGYGRKGVWHKNVGMISCHPNELTSSWIVSVDAFIALTRSEQDQKYGRIPTIVRKVQRYNIFLGHGFPLDAGASCLAASMPPAVTWGSSTAWCWSTCDMFHGTFWYWFTWVFLDNGSLNGSYCC